VGLLEASCAATSEALSDWLDGELRGLRRLRVGRHIARCSGCREALASLGRLAQMLRLLQKVETVDAGLLVEDVLARIHEGSRADGRS
jgi:predicted anti-sigma-YlaC factor YlaD